MRKNYQNRKNIHIEQTNNQFRLEIIKNGNTGTLLNLLICKQEKWGIN